MRPILGTIAAGLLSGIYHLARPNRMTTPTPPLTQHQQTVMNEAVMRAEFDNSPAIQAEFMSFERFKHYKKAAAEGRARIVGRGAKR